VNPYYTGGRYYQGYWENGPRHLDHDHHWDNDHNRRDDHRDDHHDGYHDNGHR